MRSARPRAFRLLYPFVSCLVAVPLALPVGAQEVDPHMETALRVLTTTPLIDGHNDLPWQVRLNEDAPMDVRAYGIEGREAGHTDIPRLREGRVGGQFWSIYVPTSAMETGAARFQLEQFDIAHRMLEEFPEHFGLALTSGDVMRVFHEGRIASILGMEGGHAIENSLGALRSFYDLGARYMTLTHGADLDWAGAATLEPGAPGLTEFGREVVREMNWLGMLVDISHVSDQAMEEVLDVSRAPIIFSHSSVRGLHEHQRNVPDHIVERLPENGGVIMITFVPGFLTDESPATIDDVIAHIEYARDLAGVDHVGIGADYDGITSVPQGLEDVSTYPALFAELSRRGWSESHLRKLAGENVLRVMREAEAVSRQLQRERGPSHATIEELDGER